MKKFLTMLSLVLLGFASTSCYDDSKLWEKVEDLDVRVETLETLCTQMNSNLTALTELINAMTMGDVIVGVTPIKDNGVEIGWQILLKDREPVVIYHGKNGAAGADGKDGRGVRDAQINSSGELVLVYTDGTSDTVGRVVGKDGEAGPAGAAGYTPQKGVDYYTAADKAEMVNAVLAALPAAEEASF